MNAPGQAITLHQQSTPPPGPPASLLALRATLLADTDPHPAARAFNALLLALIALLLSWFERLATASASPQPVAQPHPAHSLAAAGPRARRRAPARRPESRPASHPDSGRAQARRTPAPARASIDPRTRPAPACRAPARPAARTHARAPPSRAPPFPRPPAPVRTARHPPGARPPALVRTVDIPRSCRHWAAKRRIPPWTATSPTPPFLMRRA